MGIGRVPRFARGFSDEKIGLEGKKFWELGS